MELTDNTPLIDNIQTEIYIDNVPSINERQIETNTENRNNFGSSVKNFFSKIGISIVTCFNKIGDYFDNINEEPEITPEDVERARENVERAREETERMRKEVEKAREEAEKKKEEEKRKTEELKKRLEEEAIEFNEKLKKDKIEFNEKLKKEREETEKIREETEKIREETEKIRERTKKIEEEIKKLDEKRKKIREESERFEKEKAKKFEDMKAYIRKTLNIETEPETTFDYSNLKDASGYEYKSSPCKINLEKTDRIKLPKRKEINLPKNPEELKNILFKLPNSLVADYISQLKKIWFDYEFEKSWYDEHHGKNEDNEFIDYEFDFEFAKIESAYNFLKAIQDIQCCFYKQKQQQNSHLKKITYEPEFIKIFCAKYSCYETKPEMEQNENHLSKEI